MSHRVKSVLAAMAAWQLLCLAVSWLFGPTIGAMIFSAFTTCCGDPHANYTAYTAVALRVVNACLTAPATLLALWLIHRLDHSPIRAIRFLTFFLAWEIAVVTTLLAANDLQLAWMIHKFLWTIFGPFDEMYSFRNLALHRLIAWLICTVPIGCLSLWWHGRSKPEPAGS